MASKERGRKTETGTRGDAIIIDAAVYVGVRGGPQAWTRAGRSRWAGLGGAKGGKPTSHTPTDSLDTHRGRRYLQILARPGPKQTKGPPAGLPACDFSEGPDRGSLPLEDLEGASGYSFYLQACLGRFCIRYVK